MYFGHMKNQLGMILMVTCLYNACKCYYYNVSVGNDAMRYKSSNPPVFHATYSPPHYHI